MHITDIRRFTEGDCWVLAKRLHRLTGWPMHSFPASYDEGEFETHAFVVRPDGLCLDVEGVCTQAEMCKRYDLPVGSNAVVSLSYLRSVDCWWGRYSYERARVVADRLLTEFSCDDKV